MLNQRHTELLAFMAHIIRPNTCLYLSEMRLMQQHHAEAALSDTAADTLRQFAGEEALMEI